MIISSTFGIKRTIQTFGLAAILAASAAGFAGAGEYVPKAVVELFTSQGCSSCPPADKVMADYAMGEEVLALSWHVDYWNYLGWKDTFSEARFSERQHRYAKGMRDGQVYTPQAIVNGRDHTVGSKRGKIQGLIEDFARSGKKLSVDIDVKLTGGQLKIRVDAPTAKKNDPTLYMIYFNKSESVDITRGENRGKTIVYYNIVRDIQMLGMLNEGMISVDLPLAEVKREGYDSCAILLQEMNAEGSPGAIIGATVVDDLGA